MKLKIERTIGETWESFDMDGTYEEILALVTELGFCKEQIVNDTSSNPIDISYHRDLDKAQIISEFVHSKCYNCKHE